MSALRVKSIFSKVYIDIDIDIDVDIINALTCLQTVKRMMIIHTLVTVTIIQRFILTNANT